ncbi:MAG: gamma-glutamylcyclotransferase family protein [Desulforhopalus sp.]
MTGKPEMLYFSYGSNMSSRRIRQRVTVARFVAVAKLTGHVLRFHKVGSRDGSGKCDIFETGEPEHCVIGVVFAIKPSEKPTLDRIEGLHHGYEGKSVELITMAGDALSAVTYYATSIDPTLKPFHWYKEHVLRGAVENGLPDYYVQSIQRVASVTDPHPMRHEQEMAIYL